MPNYVNLWHAVQDPSYSYSYVSWVGNPQAPNFGEVTFTPEALDNAWAAWYRYTACGWGDAAISAVVGMQVWESGLNPWRWQGNNTIAYTDITNRYEDYPNPSTPTVPNTHGYGLSQWTPEATYSDPEGYFQQPGKSYPPNWTQWKNFFDNDPDFRASFAPHYSDVMGRASDGDAQCLMTNFVASHSVGYYFRRPGRTYTWGYMPFADFKTAVLGSYYQSGDTNSANSDYYITLDILIYQWLENYGRGAAETAESTAVRSHAASQLYTIYTGTTPPTPPTPRRRKMPFWMLLRPINF